MTFELTDSIKNDIMFAMEDQNSQSAFNVAENKVVSFIKNFAIQIILELVMIYLIL